jgi:hypothetical protein
LSYANQAAAIQAAIDAIDTWLGAFASGRDPGVLSYRTPAGQQVEYRAQSMLQVVQERGQLVALLADANTAAGTATRRTSAKFVSGGGW